MSALCNDCRADTTPPSMVSWEWYMVHDRVWQEAGMAVALRGLFLCIGCLETRLGRQLRGSDFQDCRLSTMNRVDDLSSARLRERANA